MWWWQYNHSGPSFTWMGTAHILVFIILLLLCFTMIKGRKGFRRCNAQKYIHRGISALFILGEISLQIFYITNGVWDASYALPLHLTSFVWITTILAFTAGHKIWFEVTFFAGVGSALLTIITPDLAHYGFPHYRFFHFFITHSLVILAVCYMLVVEQRTLRVTSVFRAWGVLNLYAALVFLLNLLTGGNYMYLMKKPEQTTPIDWLGPWPYYILSLETVALIVFFIMYGLYRFEVKTKKNSGASG
ncbi:YwaF family protein [Salibacterium aidingense]|uniref:YwaF family protein n=1 Tax=Salibacterium aidingense TaxID=384933 RepID=UPI0003FFA37E|nr:TIGR02206 family membrane protein [Salibacterium aidingense]